MKVACVLCKPLKIWDISRCKMSAPFRRQSASVTDSVTNLIRDTVCLGLGIHSKTDACSEKKMQQNYTVIVAMFPTLCTYPGRILLFLSNFKFLVGDIF